MLYKIIKLRWPFLSLFEPLNGFILHCPHCHERLEMRIWDHTFSKLYGSDSKWPNISFLIILTVLNDLWAHPIRTSNMSVVSSICIHHLCRNSEISQFGCTILIQQDIGRLNISVNFFTVVQVFQSFQNQLQYGSDLILTKLHLSNVNNVSDTPSHTIFHYYP